MAVTQLFSSVHLRQWRSLPLLSLSTLQSMRLLTPSHIVIAIDLLLFPCVYNYNCPVTINYTNEYQYFPVIYKQLVYKINKDYFSQTKTKRFQNTFTW